MDVAVADAIAHEYVVAATSSVENIMFMCRHVNGTTGTPYYVCLYCYCILYRNVPSRHKYRQDNEIRIYEAVALDLWRRFQFLLHKFILFKIGEAFYVHAV